MITPPPSWALITGYTAWEKVIGARRLRAITFSLNRGDTVAVSAGGAPPALLTSTSMRPVSATAASTTRLIWSGSRTSAATKVASRPAAATRSDGVRRAHTTTWAPCSRNLLAMTRPRPAVPPVTITVRPVMSRGLSGTRRSPDQQAPLGPSAASKLSPQGNWPRRAPVWALAAANSRRVLVTAGNWQRCARYACVVLPIRPVVALLARTPYRRAVPDKRMTEDEVVAELSSGMTVGIGGWGSRRKPMSLVRAILRSGLTRIFTS